MIQAAIPATPDPLAAAPATALSGPEPHGHRRELHLRVFAENGTLLGSSWPGEVGLIDAINPENETGPYLWGSSSELEDPSPMWAPLMDFVLHAPANATITLTNHTFGPTSVGLETVQRTYRLPREATLSREEADRTLRPNLTAGETVYFLRLIPVKVLAASDTEVTYAFAFDGTLRAPVLRADGLEVEGRLSLGDTHAVFQLLAPKGAFLAHNNCQAPGRAYGVGYYVVREEAPDHWTLERYPSLGAYHLEGKTATLQFTMIDGGNHTAVPKNHTH
ncbi:MAG TPA: hypothetical protein VNZ52_10420 [Candidatus Thermoplasmatota archaeon]|nr:hypothetical protein [Candidatus Thermoplasmatota archaeon]